jgi:membrane protease YdiL (CAAX protease family)
MVIALFLILVCLVLPALAWSSYRYQASVDSDSAESVSASGLAVQSLVIHGLVASLACGAAWSAELPISWVQGTDWSHTATAVVFLVVFLAIARNESKRPLTSRDALRKKLRAEGLSKPWLLVMLVASFVEEFSYRAVLYLLVLEYVPSAPAVGISAILFGLGHCSQGLRGALLSATFAVAMSVLYLLSGTLLLPILVHLTYDLAVSWMGRRLAEDAV